MNDKPAEGRGLDAWIKQLGECQMPVFARTAHEVAASAAQSEKSVAELAQVIMRDASMTARVLRLANSSFYNPGGRGVSTVSRALVLLGFNAVRSICLSIAVLDNLLQGVHRDRVTAEMARSFHAAVQARELAARCKHESPEEVFVAALLYRLGEMAFWCFSGEQGRALDAALSVPGCTRERAERAVLGFQLKQLTAGLSREWRLGELLQKALEGRPGGDARVSMITLAHDLAFALEQGWDTPQTARLVKRVADTLGLPLERATELVRANAKEAARTARDYGARKVSELIPTAGMTSPKPVPEAGAEAVQSAEPVRFSEPDPVLRLKIRQEIAAMLNERPDLNLLVSMVLEGIVRGTGMDRALFALLTPDRQRLRGKYALGWGADDLKRRFNIDLAGQRNVFGHVLDMQRALWVGPSPPADVQALLTAEIEPIRQDAAFFAVPVIVDRQAIAVVYADRQPSGRALDEESFSSVEHFCRQIGVGLAFFSPSTQTPRS